MSTTELIKEIQRLPEPERERIFEFVLHSKKPRAGWREDFAKVKKEIADEKLDKAWLNTTNEGDKDWQW